MYDFSFERPTSLADAKQLGSAEDAKYLAGGQTLLASMKLRLAAPGQIVDLGAMPELTGIRREGDTVVIGAMARHAEVATHPELVAAIPGLAQLAGGIGDRQVRTLGTIGGSVANNDPAACYPAGVLAMGATIQTDRRTIEADDFFQGLFTTALEEGELIVSLRFPIPKRSAYLKFKQAASRFALIGVCVAETQTGVRVAVTGGGNGVERQPALEEALSKSFTPEAAAAVQVDPNNFVADLNASAAYRANLVSVLTQRAVAQAR